MQNSIKTAVISTVLAVGFIAGGGYNPALAQTESISLTVDEITHESFRLSWTPDIAMDVMQIQTTGGGWTSLVRVNEVAASISPFIATADNTILSAASFISIRTTPLPIRITDVGSSILGISDDEHSNVVTITLPMPDGTGGSVMGNPPPAMPDPPETEDPVAEMPMDNTAADNTADDAADDAILPRLLHRFNDGIFRRIQQRQREDGQWK